MPEQAAAKVLQCDAGQLSSERIKRGLTNQSWRVQGCGYDVVVRLSTADEHALQIDRLREARVLKQVEHAGIGPEILWCAPQDRLLITRTLPGHSWEEHEAREPHNIKRLAVLLRRLHTLPIASDIPNIELTAVLRNYWTELELGQSEPIHDPRRARALQIARISDAQTRRCLCHTDLYHFNIIDNGERLWIIDWEYAGIGDPYFDLASVCCWHHYDAALRRQLLREYFGEVDEQSVAQLEQMCWLFDYIKELWFAVRTP